MLQTHVFADEMAELVGRDFSQSFKTGDFRVRTQFFNGFQAFILCITIVGLLLVAYTEKRCLQDINVSFLDEIREELQKEGYNEQSDMHAVHIGIGSYDDFIVA